MDDGLRTCVTAQDTTSTSPCTTDITLEAKILQIDVARSSRTTDETSITMSRNEARCITAKVTDSSTAIEEVDKTYPVFIYTPAHIHVADGVETAIKDALETVVAVSNTSKFRIIREV